MPIIDTPCDCIIHTGPHWIYSQQLWRAKNLRLRERADASQSSSTLRAYIAEEGRRMHELVRQMEMRGLVDVPDELVTVTAAGQARRGASIEAA